MGKKRLVQNPSPQEVSAMHEDIEITYDIDVQNPRRQVYIVESTVDMNAREAYQALRYLTDEVVGRELDLIDDADTNIEN